MAIIVEWHKIDGLVLDRDGIFWTRYRDGWLWHGSVNDPTVPEHLEDAAEQLTAMWCDGFDDRAEQLWNYRAATRT